MRNFKRFTAAVLAALMASTAFVGCGGGGASSSKPAASSSSAASSAASSSAPASSAAASSSAAGGAVTKLNFYAWTNPDNMKPLTEAFNKQYAGKYELVYQKLADAKTMTINTALASGEKIDVMTQASAFDLRTRADSGTYMGLKKFFDKDGLDYKTVFGDSTEQTQNVKGDYYSMPYCTNINMVYFNKKMFKAAGVDFPKDDWTWDDFRETAKKLTSGDGANKVYGAMMDLAAPNGDYYWDLIARQKLGAFVNYNKDFTATRFDDPAFKESLQFFYDMTYTDKSLVPLDVYTSLKYNDDPSGIKGLYSDKFAMHVVPVYGCLYLNKSYGEIPAGTDIGLANLPRPKDSTGPVTTCYTSTASIPAKTENPDAAWTLIKFICIDRADLFAGPKAMDPGYKFKTADDANTFHKIIFVGRPGLDSDMALKVTSTQPKLITKDDTNTIGQAKINDQIKADMSLVFSGEMKVDDALADLKTKGDQFMKADLKK